MKRLIAIAAIAIACVATPAAAAQTITQTIPPAYTSRYQIIDDMLTQQARIDELEHKVGTLQSALNQAYGQVAGLTLLRAHDIEQAEAQRAEDIAAWQAARIEDQKRIASLELNVNDLFEGCR